MSKADTNIFTSLGTQGLIVLLLCILSIGSSYFHSNLLFELTSHFKVQYFIVSVILLSYFAIVKKQKFVIWLSILVIYNSSFIIPWYSFSNNIGHDQAKEKIKVLHSNVYTANNYKQKFIDLVRHESPDIVFVQETDQKWINALQILKDKYPYFVEIARSDNFGMAIYSKIQLESVNELTNNLFNVPTLSVVVQVNEKKIEFVATHPVPPINYEYFQVRNAQLSFLTKYCSKRQMPVVLVGDLNVSMWSQHYLSLEKEAQLSNSRHGHGILHSWSPMLPFLQIPIDHVLTSKEILVLEMKQGYDIGSDHLPLVVELEI